MQKRACVSIDKKDAISICRAIVPPHAATEPCMKDMDIVGIHCLMLCLWWPSLNTEITGEIG